MKRRGLLFAALLCFSYLLCAQQMRVHRLTCDMQEGTPIVVRSPRLGWALASDVPGTRQTAYEIDICESASGRHLWNSGKVLSSQSQLVNIAAGVVCQHTPAGYTWRVRVWDEKDTPSAWSAEARFRTAPEHFPTARWIGAISRKNARLPQGRNYHGSELRRPEVKEAWESVDTLSKRSIYLRREFQAEKQIKEAIAYICGLGFYEFSLNGQKKGDSEFAPLWSDYDKSVFYNVYDVTRELKKGTNAVGVLLGNGFYNVQGGRYRKLQISFGPPTVLFSLVIRYEDGTQQVVESDGKWKYDLSPITFNCIYGGEDYDARLEQNGWNMPKFNDNGWRPVVVQDPPRGVLRPQIAAPVKIMEQYGLQKSTRLDAAQIAAAAKSTKRTLHPSTLVLDMGQNLAGFPQITVSGRRGQKITLITAESLTAEGACDQRQTGRQHYYEYTLKGEGLETWHPRFSYYGFRYIQIEGAVWEGEENSAGLPLLKTVHSCFVYNSAKKLSTFECSNPIFNATHRLIEKAVRSNMQSVFTDCPHREKLGWLEQVHLNGPGLLYNYDLTAYASQIMRNMADAQHSNGAMPTTAPEYVRFQGPGMESFAESPEWGGSFVIFPFMYYETYGDDSLIREYYPQMCRYVDYLTTRAEEHILSFGLGDWYDYGDFRAGFSRNTPVPLVATAYYYLSVDYVKKAAKMLGYEKDADRYAMLAEEIKSAFNQCFLHVETMQYGTGSQCSNAIPLYLQMLPEAEPHADGNGRKQVLENLIADVKQRGCRLTTGDVGNRYLIQALATYGENELVYQMFNHEEAPGYGFQLKFGATTLTEQWDPRQGSSWNHFMMGQIDEWFFRSLVGLRPAEPGYREFVVAPQPVGNLTHVTSSYETLYGTINISWSKSRDIFTLLLSVPVNTTAMVYLPEREEPMKVSSGKHRFDIPLSPAKLNNSMK